MANIILHENKFVDLVGFAFSRLVVSKYAGRSKAGVSLWICKCKCGRTTNPRNIKSCRMVKANRI